MSSGPSAVGDFAARVGKGERRCCSVTCEPSESESSSEDSGRRMVGVRGGGEDEGIVCCCTAGRAVIPRTVATRLGGCSGCRVKGRSIRAREDGGAGENAGPWRDGGVYAGLPFTI